MFTIMQPWQPRAGSHSIYDVHDHHENAAPLVADFLAPHDVATLRMVCRTWRATLDKSSCSVLAAAFAAPSRAGGLAANVRSLSLAPPVRCAGAAAGYALRPAAPRCGWVRDLAAVLPALASLQIHCGLPGLEDLHHLSEAAQLRHLTLVEFPFTAAAGGRGGRGGGGGGGGSDAERALRRAVGGCSKLRTLCIQSSVVSGQMHEHAPRSLRACLASHPTLLGPHQAKGFPVTPSAPAPVMRRRLPASIGP